MTAREAYGVLVTVRDHERWDDLTEWEQGFVLSLRARTFRGSEPSGFEDRTVRQIAAKLEIEVATGLTTDEDSLWR